MDINPFDSIEETPYDLEVKNLGGALYVAVDPLLDILQKRAMMRLRTSNVPRVENHIADLSRGQFIELQELYKALASHVNK